METVAESSERSEARLLDHPTLSGLATKLAALAIEESATSAVVALAGDDGEVGVYHVAWNGRGVEVVGLGALAHSITLDVFREQREARRSAAWLGADAGAVGGEMRGTGRGAP